MGINSLMRFPPAIFIAFVFGFFIKFYNNGGNHELKAWSFQLRKTYFCTLNIERVIVHQNSITFFFDTLLYIYSHNRDFKEFLFLQQNCAEELARGNLVQQNS